MFIEAAAKRCYEAGDGEDDVQVARICLVSAYEEGFLNKNSFVDISTVAKWDDYIGSIPFIEDWCRGYIGDPDSARANAAAFEEIIFCEKGRWWMDLCQLVCPFLDMPLRVQYEKNHGQFGSKLIRRNK